MEYVIAYFSVGLILNLFVEPAIRRYVSPDQWAQARFPLLFSCTFLWPIVIGAIIHGLCKKRESTRHDSQFKN